MFAYILLLYLLRALNDRSSLIEAPAHLDVGFACFSVFCICSTFSSLAIHLPEKPTGDAGHSPDVALAIRCCGRQGVVWLAALLACVFALLLSAGMQVPCMGLRLDTSLLVQPQGPLPTEVEPILDSLDLESQVASDVSLWHCVAALLRWFYYGEANCILAFVMLAVFAVGLPVVNMVVLIFAAEQVGQPVARSLAPEQKQAPPRNRAMDVAHVLKHISMLDVAIMGILVICMGSGAYKDQGVDFQLRSGILLLFLAEAVHYFTYYIVQAAAHSPAA